MRRENYRIFVCIGFSPFASTTVRAILDTGAVPNLMHIDMQPRSAQSSLRAGKLPKVRDASQRTLNILGAVLLYLRIGSLPVRIRFLVATNLVARYIPDTSFMGRYVRVICPRL